MLVLVCFSLTLLVIWLALFIIWTLLSCVTDSVFDPVIGPPTLLSADPMDHIIPQAPDRCNVIMGNEALVNQYLRTRVIRPIGLPIAGRGCPIQFRNPAPVGARGVYRPVPLLPWGRARWHVPLHLRERYLGVGPMRRNFNLPPPVVLPAPLLTDSSEDEGISTDSDV